jgi:hypothetical protein
MIDADHRLLELRLKAAELALSIVLDRRNIELARIELLRAENDLLRLHVQELEATIKQQRL